MQEEAEHLATAHPVRAMEVLVQFDGISVEWEELKRTLQGCEDSLMVASRLQSFIQVQIRKKRLTLNTTCYWNSSASKKWGLFLTMTLTFIQICYKCKQKILKNKTRHQEQFQGTGTAARSKHEGRLSKTKAVVRLHVHIFLILSAAPLGFVTANDLPPSHPPFFSWHLHLQHPTEI